MYSENTLVLHRLSLPIYGMGLVVALAGFFYWLFIMSTFALESKAVLYLAAIIVFGVIYSDLWILDMDSQND